MGLRGKCVCGEIVALRVVGNKTEFVSHVCGKPVNNNTTRIKDHPYAASSDIRRPDPVRGRPGTSTFSNAKKTFCMSQHKHDSKMEARVCDRLTCEIDKREYRLVRQIRLPLLLLTEEDGSIKYITIDFAVVKVIGTTPIVRLIDAKCQGRVSRDWPARKRAVELSWGVTIEEVDK